MKKGFQRVKVDGQFYEIADAPVLDKKYKHDIDVVVDRIVVRPDMATRLQNALLRHHLPPSLIELELTESVLMNDFAGTLNTLHALRAVGVGLSIDDFGTGYSSLAYLRCFPVQCLKLDRSFVSDLAHDVRTREIVDTVIALAHKFDVQCIAEGVESPEQAQLLPGHSLTTPEGITITTVSQTGGGAVVTVSRAHHHAKHHKGKHHKGKHHHKKKHHHHHKKHRKH